VGHRKIPPALEADKGLAGASERGFLAGRRAATPAHRDLK